MEISFDKVKRDQILRSRGLDFVDASQVMDGETMTVEDDRKDYPEKRFQTMGYLEGRLVMVVWTPTPNGRRIITMWKCNDRQQTAYDHEMGRR